MQLEPLTMTRDEILTALRGDLEALPTYPEDDSDANVREYDETLNIGLETLRDTARCLVASVAPEPASPSRIAALERLYLFVTSDPDAYADEQGRILRAIEAAPADTTRCIYPGCTHTRRTRGLCHGHYQCMRSRVRAADKPCSGHDTLSNGEKLERDLEARGLLLPKGTGGCPARDSARAFESDSTVTGDAHPN